MKSMAHLFKRVKRECYFLLWIIIIWNSVPHALVVATGLDDFERGLDKFIKGAVHKWSLAMTASGTAYLLIPVTGAKQWGSCFWVSQKPLAGFGLMLQVSTYEDTSLIAQASPLCSIPFFHLFSPSCFEKGKGLLFCFYVIAAFCRIDSWNCLVVGHGIYQRNRYKILGIIN